MFCRLLFVFSGVRVALSLVFCVMFCRSLFVFSGVRVALSFTQKTKDRATRTPLKTNNNLQNITQKTKDRATRTPLKTNNNLL
jgi:uncharacterized protein with PQ loop repeat